MREPFASAVAANRFGLGARPGELAAIGDNAPDWLRAQLLGGAPALAGDLRPSQLILREALQLQREIQAARQAAGNTPGAKGAEVAADNAQQKLPQLLRPIYVSEVTARLSWAVSTDRPFIERLTQFWTNHFAVSIDKQFLAGLAGSFEREAIRPHVLGNFSDLLLAVETHPAMLLYLDNHLSVGPHSPAALRVQRRTGPRRIGINENLAREILELHTLGVGGGYTQKDVTTFAEVITGWSIGGERRPLCRWRAGQIRVPPRAARTRRQGGAWQALPDDGFGQGVAVLRDVARERATARFIATKLARHFIADDPPPAAVERLADAFAKSGGDLPAVYRALIDSPEAWAQPLAKYKTPSDYVVSSYRGLSLPVRCGACAPRAVRGARAENLATRLARRLAGSQRRLGRRVGAHPAHRSGRRRSAGGSATAAMRCSSHPSCSAPTSSDATRAAVAHAASAAQAHHAAARRAGVHAALTAARRSPMSMQRRQFLSLTALAAGGALLTRVAFARADARPSRFVLVILRGALDGLAAVPPYGDRDYAGLRREFALRAPGEHGAALPLDGFFGLHPVARVPAAVLLRRASSSCCTRWPAPIASARISTARTCSRTAGCGRTRRRAAGSTARSPLRRPLQEARPAWRSGRTCRWSCAGQRR